MEIADNAIDERIHDGLLAREVELGGVSG
jgi:hypothetical protein